MLYPGDGRQLAGSVFTTYDKSQDVVWVMTRFDERAFEVTTRRSYRKCGRAKSSFD